MGLNELDKIQHASINQIIFYISLGVIITLIGLIVSYIKVRTIEQAKLNFIAENFKTLKEQLIENTKATKSIESNISQKQWINQQAWLKKQQCYEEIFTALLDYVHYVHYLHSRLEYEKFVEEGPEIYTDQYSSPEEIENWKILKSEIDSKKISGETKKIEDDLFQKHSSAEKKLADSIFIYSIFLDPQVDENLSRAMASAGLKIDWETEEENYLRIYEDVKTAIDNIRLICRKELQL
ncbi:hypothetical protein ACIPUO_06540 [Pectobacterium carotovorum]|uniref:hypothetical protein n=1 Tax=Pectobacterium carotovorum TaxID=554 RepID=UPI00381107BB